MYLFAGSTQLRTEQYSPSRMETDGQSYFNRVCEETYNRDTKQTWDEERARFERFKRFEAFEASETKWKIEHVPKDSRRHLDFK